MNKFLMKPFVFFNAENVRIQLDDRSYDIQVGQNLLQGLSGDGAVPAGTAALGVTNETVQPLYPSFRTSDRRHWCGNPYPRQRRTNRHTSAATGSQ